VVLLGDTNSGKTSLVLRFVEGTYKDHRNATIGAFFLTKRLTLEKTRWLFSPTHRRIVLCAPSLTASDQRF